LAGFKSWNKSSGCTNPADPALTERAFRKQKQYQVKVINFIKIVQNDMNAKGCRHKTK
jgi:hypothetical protein